MATINVCDICNRECPQELTVNGKTYIHCNAGTLALRGFSGVHRTEDGIVEQMDTGGISLDHICYDCATLLAGVVHKMKNGM